MYEQARLQCRLSREHAADLLHIGSRTLFGYEKQQVTVPAEVVLAMADLYGRPDMPARYCENECPIGQRYAHKVVETSFPLSVLEFLKRFNDVKDKIDSLIRISADGNIQAHELEEFTDIYTDMGELEESIAIFKLQVMGMGADRVSIQNAG